MKENHNDAIEVLITLHLSPSIFTQLQNVSPRLRLTMLPAHSPGEIPDHLWSRTEILYTHRVLPDPVRAPHLRWVQFSLAGIDFTAGLPLFQQNKVIATTLSGANAPQMAEHAVMMMLALGHQLPEQMKNQQETVWPQERENFSPLELRGSTVGIIGYGSVGRQIAYLLTPFGVNILAAKRDSRHPEDGGYIPKGMGDPEGRRVHHLYSIRELGAMIPLCDFLIVATPLTEKTRNLLGAELLKLMKPSAYLVDISRGGVVDQDALVFALEEKRLAGAALDVFPEEPLPSIHPLWLFPNVIITPHVAGLSISYQARAVDLFSTNLKRYLAGQPLLNQFDPIKGY